MLSNTVSYKLKASRSLKDIQDYSNQQGVDGNENENLAEDASGDSGRRPIIFSSRDGRYKNPKVRHTDFKPSRGAPIERRGYKSRGGLSSRRDREYSESATGGIFTGSRKYYSSLNRSADIDAQRSKFYESDKKNEIKFNLPEDTRISKLLRRLSTENDQENSLVISKKLLEVLLIPDNATYVRKAFHILGDSMLDILYVAPGSLAKQQAARALGRMGYIMAQENDFGRYMNWMFSKMETESDEIRFLFMKACHETLEFDRNKPVLENYAENFITEFVLALENTENSEIFKAILEILIDLVELYPEHFYSQFRDTADLLFGWHVDHTQHLSTIEFISDMLQHIGKHFQLNLDFSVSLIWNFVEDIGTYASQLKERDPNDGIEINCIEHLTVSVLAFNTVLKCLEDAFHPNNNELVSVKAVSDCLNRILNTLSGVLELTVSDNLIIAANESISILTAVLGTKAGTSNNCLYSLIDTELSLIRKFSDSTVISMLSMIATIIRELSANLPQELIHKLIGPNAEVRKLRTSHSQLIQNNTVCLYQALLNLKNIPLLQEAYRCVLGDLELSVKKIVPEISPFCFNSLFEEGKDELNEDAELSILFFLNCLSQLATSSGSIIGLWALKPSILELLGVLLKPDHPGLIKNAPTLHHCILYLLYLHSKCYNHFISSSSLVTNSQVNASVMGRLLVGENLNINDVTTKSPNSGNFAVILNVLHNNLNVKTSSETDMLLLQWLHDILINSERYLEILYCSEEFVKVANVLVKCGHSFDEKIILAVASNLEKLLHDKNLSWNNTFLNDVHELCVLQMNCNNPKIRQSYTNLLANIPWDVNVIQINKIYSLEESKRRCSNLSENNNYVVTLAQHLHQSGSIFGEMAPLHFKTFMKFLLKNEKKEDSNWLEDIFVCCWPLESDCSVNMEEFQTLALTSRIVLQNWATWEAAQLCINSKLRTTLGKPTETFTSIESCLKYIARDIIHRKGESESFKISQEQVRMLLQFMEHLEKSIYNAYEGCAVAMPQPIKTVRTFFHTNASTCKEWLARIRLVMIHIAVHIGESAIALRHGQALLEDLVKNKKTKTSEFDRAVLFTTLSLLNLRETETLYGLYVWCKNVAHKKFAWIKCAAEQSSKKFEMAAENYEKVFLELKKENDDTVESSEEQPPGESKTMNFNLQMQHFVADQIINCYKELNDWENIVECFKDKDLLQMQNYSNFQYSFRTVIPECAETIFKYESNIHAFDELIDWKLKTEDCWSLYDILKKTENELYEVAFNVLSSKTDDLIIKVDQNLLEIQNTIQNSLVMLPSEFLQTFNLMQYIANGLKNILNSTPTNTVFLVSENFEKDLEKIDSTVLTKILWWSEFFAKTQDQGFSAFCSNLRLDIINKSRKERNLKAASLHINKFLEQKEFLVDEHTNSSTTPLQNIASMLIQKSPEVGLWSLDLAKVAKEIIKLLYLVNDKQLTFNLCAAVSTGIFKNAELFGGKEMREISSRILLKLASWLQQNENACLTDITSPLSNFLMVLPEINVVENVGVNIIPSHELAVGKILHFSVHQCATLAKTWNAFGTWCYRWGRKVVDHSSDLSNLLTEDDKLSIQQILPPETKQEDLARVLNVLSQTYARDEDDIDSREINITEIIQTQLEDIPALFNADEKQMQTLVFMWKNAQKRIYAYYELSAQAYFKYLQLATTSGSADGNRLESNIITATLRLLRLIVKHALELQNVLENGLASTPTYPWKAIIPQLFSRMNHPENYVRFRVSELLCRIAEDAPHLITFPAVVGAVEGGVKFDFSEISLSKDYSQSNDNNEYTELNDLEDVYESDTDDSNKTVLQSCFKSMVETLSKQDPETIAQVQLFVKELRRITLLWDELWLGTLFQHHSEINKRQQMLEQEIEKVNENPNLDKQEKISLITEKYRIIVKPIVFILEQLYAVTSTEPETPHEKNFQDQYLPLIEKVMEQLKKPENPEKVQECWQPLRMLQTKFQQKTHKRTSYTLKMQDISPTLAGMKDTVIAMPGIESVSKGRITIVGLSNHVSILPTKTKPKKLMFYGSDGQTYTYLFKGLEDLHLDERIMQFLSITNTMMQEITNGSDRDLYRARHYSVIPLGPRSGLISWVDGKTPVFALYKRWQQREATKPVSKSSSTANSVIQRPSELFYNKLNPLLQDYGVKNLENRKEWPLSILKQVLVELMNETPSDLLAKELWCNAINAGVWWQVVRKYSYSIAVMSIIGYIIGLGDRHLDNVLVDLSSGEVVHIDYNVCFEKGKTLRVPEKVPFRLTPNIREALGVTGVEGIFRLACENVLKTMKKGKETLLTLLEAFVYDPLIDWTVGGEGLAGTAFRGVAGNSLTKQSRKDMEKEVTISMFHVRCTELQVDWKENRDAIVEGIPKLMEKLKAWLSVYEKTSQAEDTLQDLHQQMALVKEAEAYGTLHSLYSLPSRYEAYCKTKNAINNAKKELESLMLECETIINAYAEAVKMLEMNQCTKWFVQQSSAIAENDVFELVRDFLLKAGQMNTILQCEQSEASVSQLRQKQKIVALKSINMLKEYFDVLSHMPLSYQENHTIGYILHWCKSLLEMKSVDFEDVVFQQFRTYFDNMKTSSQPVQYVAEFSHMLRVLYNESAAQVSQVYEEYRKHRVQDANNNVEKVYNESKLAVASFLRRESAAYNAFEFIIVTELLNLNQNYLNYETAASRGADFLLKIASRYGDWFLDDLTWFNNKAMEFVSYLFVQQNSHLQEEPFVQTITVLKGTNFVYKGLQELYFSFHTIILPESVKKIQKEEPSVMGMIRDLKKLIMSAGTSLQDLVIQLEKCLACTVMEMDTTASFVTTHKIVSDLKFHFASFLQPQSEELSHGMMLLMGFNGLFEKLSLEFDTLIGSITSLDIPPCWKKLDQVRDAKCIAAPIYNERCKAILDDIFLLKRLQAMSDFFDLCVDAAASFKGLTPPVAFDDEKMDKPIKRFVADFITRQFLGVTTENIVYVICFLLEHMGLNITNEIEQKDVGAENKVPLEELLRKGYGVFMKQGLFNQNVIAQASSLETNMKSSWENTQKPKQLDQKLSLWQSTVERIKHQLMAHSWLHEDILVHRTPANEFQTTLRSTFLHEMTEYMKELGTIHAHLKENLDTQKNLISSIMQRLTWAAGANPDLSGVLTAFEASVSARENDFKLEETTTALILKTTNGVIQYEMLRLEPPDSNVYCMRFLKGCVQWKEACPLVNSEVDAVSTIEENIMKLYTNEMAGTPNWIPLLSEKISQIITQTQKELTNLKEETFFASHDVVADLDRVKNSYMRHCKLMGEFKNLIKSLTRVEECASDAQLFIVEYKKYAEHFGPLLHKLKKELTKEDVQDAVVGLERILNRTEAIYNGLLELEKCPDKGETFRTLMKTDEEENGLLLKAQQKENGSRAGHQRNSYAIGVWKRVRMKLEGRDPDPGRKVTVQEQVDYVINEATNLDNLALLYEGWTPWV
ncbi:serine/threonine-protein kinase SMG1 [Agrilus planipennis]|uniref:non-specific serine/threonine protein kinase n=1 Tax=Agrilus planipennis TaxID=224129 RepID=A0A7F5RNU1_AGRPL|nr:serine/threonine-protein kinase SMG1 [Agrilus planipennis]